MNTLILVTDIVEKSVLILLLILSIWSIATILKRRRMGRESFVSDSEGLSSFRKLVEAKNWRVAVQQAEASKRRSLNIVSEGIKRFSGETANPNSFDRWISSEVKNQKPELEKGLSLLGTLGANAPFIGLFGTVLGIIRAFAFLGTQGSSTSVMSGVSQALYATAAGLLVAIPAVIAYNYFSKQVKLVINEIESLRDLFISQSSVQESSAHNLGRTRDLTRDLASDLNSDLKNPVGQK